MAAGTLFGIGLSQQSDVNGRPMPGCLLYLYQANTSTPVTAYKNTGLTPGQEHPNPIVADANGRIPAFWLDAAFNYRARLTDVAGIVQFDEPNILPIGAVSGGGGGGDTTDPNSVASTGDVKWRAIQGTLAGWVRMNGRTIGSATSGASERAAADCQPLFEHIWNNFSDAFCPVSTGRGASSLADWTANKTITLLDMRNKSQFGLDDMCNAAGGGFANATFAQGNATTAGSKGGGPSNTLTPANLPPYTPSGTNTAPIIQSHTRGRNDTLGNGATLFVTDAAGDTAGLTNTSSSLLNAPVFTGAAQGGTSTPFNNMSPFMLGTWFWRL